MLANCIRVLSAPLPLCTRSAVRECENKRREKQPALGCPCGCVTRLWMLAGVGEGERERGFGDCVVRVGGSFGRVRVREDCCWGGALERSALFRGLRFFCFWFSWLEIVEVRYGKVVVATTRRLDTDCEKPERERQSETYTDNQRARRDRAICGGVWDAGCCFPR